MLSIASKFICLTNKRWRSSYSISLWICLLLITSIRCDGPDNEEQSPNKYVTSAASADDLHVSFLFFFFNYPFVLFCKQ